MSFTKTQALWIPLVLFSTLTDVVSAKSSGHHDKALFAKRLLEVTKNGYISPFALGGNMSFSFDDPENPSLRPEPINTIISGNSWFGDFQGLNNSDIFLKKNGFAQYLSALNISDECLGLHLSNDAYARVNGPEPEILTFLYRENFGDFELGTCNQTFDGGLKFRGWRQNNTGAFFLAPAISENLEKNHDPVPDGYDLGRDEVARRAALGGRDHRGCFWPPAKIENVTGLLKPDNGGPKGTYNHGQPVDGIVTVLTVGKPICPGGINGTNGTNGTNSTWGHGRGGKGHGSPTGPVNIDPSHPGHSGSQNGGGSGGSSGGGLSGGSGGGSSKKPPSNSAHSDKALVIGTLVSGLVLAVLAL